ncbi:hypothetical protein NX722_17555 [Endozoicomonas gorgoniicola]|uniref:Auxin efflux carrier n=1 Tax=Endozoicomonas gorgoniicola TaxID=1234144 RepID=A0ABT3MYD3_9GAMM|nr:hypothetical protein [Endozoicomonas gorgoniicola]MCW7554393.1 hypothetical protein [Endozoicomonas gorgoniicola]
MPDTLLFTAGVTLPVCIMLLAGILLKKTGYIDDHFIRVSSRLVFNFGLPAVSPGLFVMRTWEVI